jgi:hypothetical protein
MCTWIVGNTDVCVVRLPSLLVRPLHVGVQTSLLRALGCRGTLAESVCCKTAERDVVGTRDGPGAKGGKACLVVAADVCDGVSNPVGNKEELS